MLPLRIQESSLLICNLKYSPASEIQWRIVPLAQMPHCLYRYPLHEVSLYADGRVRAGNDCRRPQVSLIFPPSLSAPEGLLVGQALPLALVVPLKSGKE